MRATASHKETGNYKSVNKAVELGKVKVNLLGLPCPRPHWGPQGVRTPPDACPKSPRRGSPRNDRLVGRGGKKR